jgi:long-chain fatty acid transport protein
MKAKVLSSIRFLVATLCCLSLIGTSQSAFAQGFGVELHNNLTPAAGGMGGTSIAEPQDLLAAINGNPANVTQFQGTQFTFSGAWVEPTINLAHTGDGDLPGITPFAGKSQTPGSALGNIGITQDFNAFGRSVTAGVGLVASSGLGVDYTEQPNSNNSAITLQILAIQPTLGIQVTDRLSIGANLAVGIGLFDGLFTGQSKATPDYSGRGTIGINYAVTPKTKFGFYYRTKSKFVFDNAIVLQPFAGLPGNPVDIEADLPPDIGFGISNSSLASGRLLVAADLLVKFWQEAALFDAVYTDQLAVQLGAQYTGDRAKLRMGYTWVDSAMVDVPGNVIGGVTPPGAANAIQYIQALAPNINQHRISAGIGIPNMLPGIDMDMFVGGMLENGDTFGLTSVSVESYYLGGGLTWRFRRGSGCKIAPDEWCAPEVCSTGE